MNMIITFLSVHKVHSSRKLASVYPVCIGVYTQPVLITSSSKIEALAVASSSQSLPLAAGKDAQGCNEAVTYWMT